MLVKDGAAALPRSRLEQAGVRVVAEVAASRCLAEVAAVRPDVVLIDCDTPSRDMLECVRVMSMQGGQTVVMFTADDSRDAIRAALGAGVAGYVAGMVENARIRSLLEVAIERHRIDVSRRAELADAQRQLAERKVVEKAKGLLMAMKGLDEAAAYKQLRERAMKQQKKLVEVAQEIISLAAWLKS
ncbi:ANTAR domain-containing response regulator [Vogesella fluminis]|uniref:Transcriptional regulator n=1 Tax=Vogesella fluminis TaxID=1069161 RepID=A0ABQ3HCB1_9NEIS|nr:ANTAR domain-containing protein [Vogesella fluminis]GHD78712.1 transcriptional regulator [Vogesella fluminis]